MSRIAAIAVWYDAKGPVRGLTVAIEPAGGRSPSRYYCNANFERLHAIYYIIFDYSAFRIRPFTATKHTIAYVAERHVEKEKRP